MPKAKEADDLSDVSMCSMTSEAPLSKEEIVARIVEEFQFSGTPVRFYVENMCGILKYFCLFVCLSTYFHSILT